MEGEVQFNGERLAGLAEIWNDLRETDIQYYLSRKRNNPESKLGQFDEILKPLEERAEAKGIDFHYFWYDYTLYFGRKAFDHLERAEEFMNEYKALGITPYWLFERMFEEIQARQIYLNKWANPEFHTPTQEEIKDYFQELEANELEAYVFDPISKDTFLRDKHKAKIQAIKEAEKEGLEIYGYYLNSFFKAGQFVGTKEGLNDFFISVYSKGFDFLPTSSFLRGYFEAHKEALMLKKILAGETGSPEQKQKISKALQFLKRPKKRREHLTETEFEQVVNWVNAYFDNGFKVPTGISPFEHLPANKGDILYGFKKLFQSIGAKPLPATMPELLNSIFTELKTDLKAIQGEKKPQYFRP